MEAAGGSAAGGSALQRANSAVLSDDDSLALSSSSSGSDLAAITDKIEQSVLQSLDRITSGVESAMPETPGASPAQSPQPVRRPPLQSQTSEEGVRATASFPTSLLSLGEDATVKSARQHASAPAEGRRGKRNLEVVKDVVRKEKARIQRLLEENKDALRKRQRELVARQERMVAEFNRKTQAFEARISEPLFVRFVDKLCFLVCIICLAITEAILLKSPAHMYQWYTVLVVPLLAIRYYSYHKQRWHYFVLDFCYFMQVLLVFYLFIYPTSAMLFAVVFVHSNGPVGWSVITWRNSLVFHDINMVTSFYIHGFSVSGDILPSLVSGHARLSHVSIARVPHERL
eukprot:Opistho-1_new@68